MLGLPLGIFFSNWLSGSIVHHSGWRAAFYVACVPGLLCGLLTLFIKEPMRPGRPEGPGNGGLTHATTAGVSVSPHPRHADHRLDRGFRRTSQLQYVRAQRFCAGPVDALLRRGDPTAGLVAGVSLGAVGIVGLLVGGWVADRVQRVRPNGRLLVAALAMLLSVPCLYFGISQPPGQMAGFMAWVGAGVMLMYVYYAGVYAAIQDVVEPGLRGTAMALYFFVMYVLGGAFGTYVLGGLSDWFAARAMRMAGESLVKGRVPEQFRGIGLHQAMYVVPLLCVGLAIVLFAASRTVGRDMRKLADWYAESSGESGARRIRQTAGRCGRDVLALVNTARCSRTER